MRRFTVLLLAGSVVLGIPLALATAQSVDLVELRKKEEERRKKLKKEGKTSKIVITDQTLRETARKKGETGPPVIQSQQEGDEQSKEGARPSRDKKQDPKKTREFWQEKAQRFRSDLRQLKDLIQKKEEEIKALIFEYNMSEDFYERDDFDQKIGKAREMKKGFESKLEEKRREWEELQKEARKNHIPPGWLR